VDESWGVKCDPDVYLRDGTALGPTAGAGVVEGGRKEEDKQAFDSIVTEAVEVREE
jgi:hypothetical protein